MTPDGRGRGRTLLEPGESTVLRALDQIAIREGEMPWPGQWQGGIVPWANGFRQNGIMQHTQTMLEFLALGTVLGGRRDLLGRLSTVVQTPHAKSLLAAMEQAQQGSSDLLYGWFKGTLGVELDRENKLAEALVAELEETARLISAADAGIDQWAEAAKNLVERRTSCR